MAPAARRFPHMSPRGGDKACFVICNVVRDWQRCTGLTVYVTVYTPQAVMWAATRSAATGFLRQRR